MNRYYRSLVIAVVALSAVIFCGVDSRSFAGPAYERELDEQQKIEGRNDTGCIEVLESKVGSKRMQRPYRHQRSSASEMRQACRRQDMHPESERSVALR